MRKILRSVAAITLLAGIALVSQPAPAGATHQVTTKTVRYGPFTIPAASGMDMGHIENQLNLWVNKPCTGCVITSMTPNLVYPDGTRAGANTGTLLHHMVLSSQFRSDPTCSGNLLGLVGERFFASGDERTVIEFPPGYGYRVGYLDQWNMITDLMNMEPMAQTVYIEMTFTYRSGSADLQPVKPVWLDVDQCGDSEYSVPAGHSDTHWDWNVNVPGRIVAIGGHVHTEGMGMGIEATNETTGQSICNSVATYGGSPEYVDMMGMEWISDMSRCIADPVATVARGDTVRIHSEYHAPEPTDGVMGIMIGYIDQ